MCLWHLFDETMSAQQCEQTTHAVGLATMCLLIRRRGAVDDLAEVAVAESADQKLAPLDALQYRRVGFTQRIQTPVTPSPFHHRATQRRTQLRQRGRQLDRA